MRDLQMAAIETLVERFENLEPAELYLFHPSDSQCPSESSLWGLYDRCEEGVIYLEHSTTDQRHFQLWRRLPGHYLYCRLATRSELRDYMYNLGIWDTKSRLLNLVYVDVAAHYGIDG